jgi:hypothetical protein
MRKSAQASAVLLSPARKTINKALTHVAKDLPDDKAEARQPARERIDVC